MDLTEVKALLDEQGKAFAAFKEARDQVDAELKKLGAADVVLTEKVDRINTALDKFEDYNQRLTKAQAEAKKAGEAVDAIETKLGRLPAHSGDNAARKAEIKKSRNDWARAVVLANTVGLPNLSEDQRKALADVEAEYKVMTIANDTTGGYLAPSEYVAEIIKGVTEMSALRSVARVRPISTKSYMQPKRTASFAGGWVSESGTRTETTGLAYGMVEVPAHEMYALIDVSTQNLEDSAFDLEGEIRMEAVEQFAVLEGAAFVSGNGVGKPFGFTNDSNVSSTNSGAATTVTADAFFTVFHALKTAYTRNAVWTLNRTTLGSVRKLKAGDGSYIWMPGLQSGVPNTILGAPYLEMPDMANEGAGTEPVAFGDFGRGYVIVDRVSMAMLRDPFTQATSGNIRFMFRRRVGGQVVLGEAIRTMTCSA